MTPRRIDIEDLRHVAYISSQVDVATGFKVQRSASTMPRTTATARKSTGAPAPRQRVGTASGDHSHCPLANHEDGTSSTPPVETKAGRGARAKKKQKSDNLPNKASIDPPTSNPSTSYTVTAAAKGGQAVSAEKESDDVCEQQFVKPYQ